MTTPASSSSSSPASAATTPPRGTPARAPLRDQHEQFETALRRCRHDDEAPVMGEGGAGATAAFMPLSPATPMTVAPQDALRQAAITTAPGAPPRTAPRHDAVSMQLHALGTTPTEAARGHWQLQWPGASAPVQQVDLRRGDHGTLHLGLAGNTQATDPARLARLRERVAARAPTADVQLHTTAHRPTSDTPDTHHRDDEPTR